MLPLDRTLTPANLFNERYMTVKRMQSKRYIYCLTPVGFAEKPGLAYDLLSNCALINREVRSNNRQFFLKLERSGAKRIVFAGADEQEQAYDATPRGPRSGGASSGNAWYAPRRMRRRLSRHLVILRLLPEKNRDAVRRRVSSCLCGEPHIRLVAMALLKQ
jgi:hypothetical protein